MARHIFLTGKKQIGKSTLLQKILKNYQGTADGFLIVCGKANEHTADTFNCLGCRILSMCSDCSLLIMDELGPHEAKAALFREEILHLLDGQIPVLGVLQEPAEACWPEIVNHPNVEIITLSESNRNNSSLCEHILSDF